MSRKPAKPHRRVEPTATHIHKASADTAGSRTLTKPRRQPTGDTGTLSEPRTGTPTKPRRQPTALTRPRRQQPGGDTGTRTKLPRQPTGEQPDVAAAGPDDFEQLVDDLVDAGSREHYADAVLYDYEYRRRRADVTFYRELARRRLGTGRILELGAGTGRVTIPLARDGHRVVAVDQSASMLDRLRTRVDGLPAAVRDRIEIARGDLRTFDLGAPKRARPAFPLAIAAFNVLEHLYTRGEVSACLARIAAHLEPGGVFAFDVQLPDLGWLIRDPRKRWAKTRFTDPATGRAMFYSTNHDYDPVSQIVLIRLYYDPVDGVGPGRVVKLTQRKFFPAELEALVSHAGFRVVERFGDFSFGPLLGSSESQVLVCQKVEGSSGKRP